MLDAYLFTTVQEVRDIALEWNEEYNSIRPHYAFQGLSPYKYAIQYA